MKKKPFTYIKSFGLRLYLTQIIILVLSKFNILLKLRNKLRVSKNKQINKILTKRYQYLIDKYKNITISNQNKSSNKIWIFWYQGLENAPLVIKKNILTIKHYCKDREIVILTKDNICEYYDMPNFIRNKINNNQITITYLSDILRMNLLKKYGGFWMDATMFLTDNPLKNNDFYTIKFHTDEETSISKCLWVIGFIGGQNQLFYDFMVDFFNDYWSKEELVIDYFMTDYVIRIAYDNIKLIKDVFDKVDYNNKDLFKLQTIINNKYDDKVWKELVKNNQVHRLTYKEYINMDDKENYYAKIINKIDE